MKKNQLHHVARWALFMLFTLSMSTPVNAQFGGLLKKAKSVATGSDDTQNRSDADASNRLLNKKVAENELGVNSNQTTTSKSSSLNKIYEGTSREDSKVIATWNPDTKQFTLVRTFTEGDLAGQPIVYTVDFATGAITRNDGKLMATLTESDVVFPEIGTLSINSTGGLKLNDQPLGKVTRTEAYCYGRQFGSFQKEATRQLVAFFLFNEFATKDELAKLKGAMEKRDKAAAQGQAAFQANVRKITAGKINDVTGRTLGQITANGDILNSAGKRMGHIAANGLVTSAQTNSRIGMIDAKGFIEDKTGSRIGHLQPNGDVDNISGTRVGHIYPNGDIDNRTGSKVAHFTGEGRYVAAACYFFFFSFK